MFSKRAILSSFLLLNPGFDLQREVLIVNEIYFVDFVLQFQFSSPHHECAFAIPLYRLYVSS